MRPAAWLERLQWLVARFPECEVDPDLGALCIADAWGVYRFLSRLANGGEP
jgi:hypothetical protein